MFACVFIEGERTCREGWNAETKQPQAPNNRRRTANAKPDADGINVLRFDIVGVAEEWFRIDFVIVVCLVLSTCLNWFVVKVAEFELV
jgi:hypothetical protein